MDSAPSVPASVQVTNTQYPSLAKTKWLVLLVLISFTVDLILLVGVFSLYIKFGNGLTSEVFGAILVTCLLVLASKAPYLLSLILSITSYAKKSRVMDYTSLIFWHGILLALTLNETIKLYASLIDFHLLACILYTAGVLLFGLNLFFSIYKYRSVQLKNRYLLTLLLSLLLVLLGQGKSLLNIIDIENDSVALEELTTNGPLEKVGEFEALETESLIGTVFVDDGYIYFARYKLKSSHEGTYDVANEEKANADSFEVYKMDLSNGDVTKFALGDFSTYQIANIANIQFADSPSGVLLKANAWDGSVFVLLLQATDAKAVAENLISGELTNTEENHVWLTNVTDASHADLVIPSLLKYEPSSESFITGYTFPSDFSFGKKRGTSIEQYGNKLVFLGQKTLYEIDLDSNKLSMIDSDIRMPDFSKNGLIYYKEESDVINFYGYNPVTEEISLVQNMEFKNDDYDYDVLSSREADYTLVKEKFGDADCVVYLIDAESRLSKTPLCEQGEVNFINTWQLENQIITLVNDVFYLYKFTEDSWELSVMDPGSSTFSSFPSKFEPLDKFATEYIDFFESGDEIFVLRNNLTKESGGYTVKHYLLKLDTEQLDFEKL